MGNYEPLKPQVLGMEWAPVRQESILLDGSVELGYSFSVNTAVNSDVVTARWMLSHFPTTPVVGQVPFVTIYRRGEETNIGSIHRVTVPVASVSTTGATISSGTSTAALTSASDDLYLTMRPGNSRVLANFTLTGDLQNALQNRRILKVNLLYVMSGPFAELDNVSSGFEAALESSTDIWSYGLGSITGPPTPSQTSEVSRVSFGEVNPFWNAGASPYAQSAKYPWRWEELDRLRTGTAAANRYAVSIRGTNIPTTTQSFRLTYMALEIVFCEENRLFYGGASMGDSLAVASTAFDAYSTSNDILLRTTSFQTTGSLQPGTYTATITLADAGVIYNRGDKPRVSALRQAEELPTPGTQGVLITRWQDPEGLAEDVGTSLLLPKYYFAGDVPTQESYDVLPGIDILRGAGSPINITAPHTYAVQIPARVYTDTYAEQLIINDSQAPVVYYPWVRFYARRFGDVSRTLQLRNVTAGSYGYTVSIDQDTFDALPEIVDGWREVTLYFDSATPSFQNNGSTQTWRWETINGNVNVQNRWEVLGAYTNSLSGEPTYGQITAYATFNNVSRAPGVELSNVNTDMTLMFSQEMPLVTGFGVTTASQAVTGVTINCYSPPECIPTGIYYNHLTWSAGNFICDTFSRSAIGSWGIADTGQSYSVTGTGSATHSVDGSYGEVTHTATGTSTAYIPSVVLNNPRLYTEISFSSTPASGTASKFAAGFVMQYQNTLNHYRFLLVVNSDRTLSIRLDLVFSLTSTIATTTVPNIVFVPGQIYRFLAQYDQGTINAKVWEDGTPEPGAWHFSGGDSNLQLGNVGLYTAVTGTGSYPVTVEFDNFVASELVYSDGHFELQRSDDFDTTWQTIMMSDGQCPISFNDYEARVGVTSYYRIRRVNELRFPGPWSATVSNTLTSPGVAGVESATGVLIFTTNEVQSGERNLAHVMVWDQNVTEDFSYPEAGTVQLQTMYERDYAVAFRPTERGGERFSRMLLVNNAVIPISRLQTGFTSLRDMAWDDVSYICVRNELGDRWLAAVIVPSGSIQGGRRKLLSRVDIIEVTDVPSQVEVDSISIGGDE